MPFPIALDRDPHSWQPSRTNCCVAIRGYPWRRKRLRRGLGVVGLPRRNQHIDKIWRPPLHLIDIDAGVEERRPASDAILADERKLTLFPAR